MNHVYRIVWSQAKSCWQAVCETASTRSKNTSSRTVLNKVHGSGQELLGQRLKPSYTAVLCGLGLLAGTVSAGPTGGQVSAGTASITQSGATTTIQQASQKAAIDWTGFSVGKSESVRFNQPNASAITLNRVTGTERSEILGNLSANGQVFILNPNGVLFGKGAQVNVGGLVASTLRMSNEDFMAGNYKFTEGVNGSAAVVNEGRIQVAEGGVLALIAPVVTNTGTLIAPQGSVLMAGADAVTVTLQDGSLVSYTIDKGNLQALVDNGGLIQAEGGHVVLTAKGLDALSRAVVNHSGVIEAQTVSTKNGIVELLGDMEVGLINMSGRIDASAPNGGDGGFVETSAAKVTIQPDAYITTLASKGKTGKFLLDPTDLTIAKQGGDLTGAWVSGQLARNNVFLESTMGSTSGNGDVFVSDRISWSANTTLNILAGRNIQINAEIEALGSSAGVALTTGVLGGGTYSIGSGGRITLSGANASFALNGTPYKVIRNVQQLQAMKDDLLGNYVLGVDIDASGTSTWNGGKGFQPVGQGANNFMGVLDGLGHQVNGLYINRPSESEVGLIGSMEAMVRNIGVSGANITGLDSVGALAGQLRWGSSVSQSFASGKVTGRGNVGGLIGFATPYHYGVPYWCSQCIAIDQSYADVAVAGQGGVGGLVGTIDQTSITNSYAVGNVSSPEIVGGLVGHNWSSYIVNSYSSGLVQGQASGVGGLVGLHNGNVINSHYDSQTSGLPGGNTTAEMKQQATFVGWDFNGVWRIVEGSSYPILRALTKDKLTLTVSAANETKVYNAEPWNPNPSDYISYAGFAGGDNPGSLSGVLRLEGAAIGAVDAGTYGYSGAGLSSQKYEISYLPGYLTITPSPISISGARPYDASNRAYAVDVNSLNGVFERDKGLVSVVSGSGVLSGANVGEWSLSSVDTLTLGGKAAGNYRLVEDGNKWTISRRPIEFIGNKVYDGSVLAASYDSVLISNVPPVDVPNVSVGLNGYGNLESKDVGVRRLKDSGSLSITGLASANYILTGGSWIISPRPLVLVAQSQSIANGFIDFRIDVYGNLVPALFDPNKIFVDIKNGDYGLVEGDKVTGSLSVAGYDRLPGVYDIIDHGSLYAGQNYSISFIPGKLYVSGGVIDAAMYSTFRIPEVLGGRIVDNVVIDPVKEIAKTFNLSYQASGFRHDPIMTTLMWGSAISRVAVTGIDAFTSYEINALKSVIVGTVTDYCAVLQCPKNRREYLEKGVSLLFDVINSAFSISKKIDETADAVQSFEKSLHNSMSNSFGEGTADFLEMQAKWRPFIQKMKNKELSEGVLDIGKEATMGAYSIYNTIFSED